MEYSGVGMKKVLFVSGQDFLSDQRDGGKKCCLRNYEMLKRAYGQENVHVAFFSNEKKLYMEKNIKVFPSHRNIFEKVLNIVTGHLLCNAQTEDEIIKYVQDNNIEVVLFERAMFGKLICNLSNRNVTTQIFMENIEAQYFYNKVKYQNRLLYPIYVAVKNSEKKSFCYVNEIFCLTDRDARNLKEIYQRDADCIFPMTFKDCFTQKQIEIKERYRTEKEKNLLFVGSMFPPNYEGIKWFVENVMSELPEWTLTIVGKDFEEKKEELTRNNVRVVGTVDELAIYYLSDNVMIMPILFGDGMKIKTAEAMMYGKIIFATHEALEGYDVKNVEHIYECNSAEEFVKKIRKYYPQDAKKFFAEDVRKCFLERYESEGIVEKFARLI